MTRARLAGLAAGQAPASALARRLQTPQFRRATAASPCGRPGCDDLILTGQVIVRAGAARAWRHLECEYPRHIPGSGRPERRVRAA
jgi:hypothetical protein